MYCFHIYLSGKGSPVSFYDLSRSETFALKKAIEKAEFNSFIEMPINPETKKIFILKSSIAYYEYFIKDEYSAKRKLLQKNNDDS